MYPSPYAIAARYAIVIAVLALIFGLSAYLTEKERVESIEILCIHDPVQSVCDTLPRKDK